ncbi:MAG: pentapeptide repeat-containing protein [Cyanobacteria bacterium P01_F01_bin.33]
MAFSLSAEALQRLYTDGRRNFRHAELLGAILAKFNLKGIDLSEANLAGADLTGANLEGARLIGANLTGAKLGAAKLSCALLEGANLETAELQRAELRYATYDGATRFTASFIPERAGMQRGSAGVIHKRTSMQSLASLVPPPTEEKTARPSPTPPAAAKSASPQWLYRGRPVVR